MSRLADPSYNSSSTGPTFSQHQLAAQSNNRSRSSAKKQRNAAQTHQPPTCEAGTGANQSAFDQQTKQAVKYVYPGIIGVEPTHFYLRINNEPEPVPSSSINKLRATAATSENYEYIAETPQKHAVQHGVSASPFKSEHIASNQPPQSMPQKHSVAHPMYLSPIHHQELEESQEQQYGLNELDNSHCPNEVPHNSSKDYGQTLNSHESLIHSQEHYLTDPQQHQNHHTAQHIENFRSPNEVKKQSVAANEHPRNNSLAPVSSFLYQKQIPRATVQSMRLDSAVPNRESEAIELLKDNISYATVCRKHDEQSLTLFNARTKQLTCIECIYNHGAAKTRQTNHISVQNAIKEITECNKSYKAECKEILIRLEDQLHTCQSNYETIQQNLDYMFTTVTDEFNSMHEELRERERVLIESLRAAAEIRRESIVTKTENLEFLYNCYKDAREVDPNRSVEQSIHFYGVYNLLRSTIRVFDPSTPHVKAEELEYIDFSGQKEYRSLLKTYGKVISPSQSQLATTAKSSTSLIEQIQAKRSVDRSAERGPNKLGSRSITPAKYEKTPSPKPSYQEREILRHRIKERTKSQAPSSVSVSKPKSSEKKQSFSRTASPESHSKSKPRPISRPASRSKRQSPARSSPKYERKPLPNEVELTAHTLEANHITSNPVDLMSPASRSRGSVEQRELNQQFRSMADKEGSQAGEQISMAEVTRNSARTIDAISFTGEPNIEHFSESSILMQELRHQMCQMLPSLKGTQLMYKLSKDGPSSAVMHQKCDGCSPLLVLIRANDEYVFGYYVPVPFEKEEKYTECDSSFIFSLQHPERSKPVMFPIKADKKFIAVYQNVGSPCLGSTIMNKQDLWFQ